MNNKPQQIIELEKYLGFELRETTNPNDIFDYKESESYFLDNKKQIIGLNLFRSKVKDFSFLQILPNLTSLNLEYNELSNISFLQDFTNLTKLNLYNNQISDISFLKNLRNLRFLVLGNNKISDISYLQNLTNLTELYLIQNQISDISFLQGLTNLTNLNLGFNQIKDISTLQNLTNLTSLNLTKNENITNFKVLNRLQNLINLDLSANKILDISFLENLDKLIRLDLSNNYISNISTLSNLQNLKILDLRGNEIKEISPTFLNQFKNLNELYLYANLIQNIPKEIFDKIGNVLEDVRNYFIAVSQGQIINAEAKVIWIGNGEAGKTTLSHQLRKNEFISIPKEDRTHGILINEWQIPVAELPYFKELQEITKEIKILSEKYKGSNEESFEIIKSKINDGIQKKILLAAFVIAENHLDKYKNKDFVNYMPPEYLTLKLWDFGGQEYYHATHSLFLSNNAMYLLVWDEETNLQDEEKGIYPLEYWRESIKNYAPKSVVFQIQNKAKENSIINHKDLKYKVHFRKENEKDIAKYNLDIEDLKESIFSQLHHLEYLAKPFPQIYDHIRNILKNQEKPFILFEDYKKLCQENDITELKILQDDSQIKTLTNFLHEIGAIICYHYKENISDSLKNYVFLNPIWLTDYIYKILSKDIQQEKKGEFDLAHIQEKTSDSNIEAETWVELMKNFELIFEKKNEKNQFVCPQYLPKNCQDLSEKAFNNLQKELPFEFTLYYPKFLAKSVISRFISIYGNLANDYYWKYGIVIHEDNKKSLIMADYTPENNKNIVVKSNNENFLTKIFQSLFLLSNQRDDIELFSKEKNAYKSIKEIKEYKESYQKEFYFVFPRDSSNDFKIDLKQKNMNQNIQKALKHLENAYTAGYFEEMDKIEMPSSFKPLYAQHKGIFLSVKNEWNFNQQLETFAREVDKLLNGKQENINKQPINDMYGIETQIQGIKNALDILLEKESFFQEELTSAYESGKKFALKKDLKNIQDEIEGYRKKINDLLSKSNNDIEVQSLQTQNENIKNMFLRLEAKIDTGFAEQNENSRKILESLGDVKENIRELISDILPQISTENIQVIEQMFDTLKEVNAQEANILLETITAKLPANLPNRAEVENQLNSMEVTTNGKLKLVIPIIPNILSYEIEMGKQWTDKIPKVWQKFIGLFRFDKKLEK